MAFALMVYDYLLTFGHEVDLVWNAPWGFIKIMYILTRYVPFTMIGMIDRIAPEMSATKCKFLYVLQHVSKYSLSLIKYI
ncbi:hypothetical protein BDQ17DRAFT_451851 [Cyathus striatus]|nr:hypothetical protein BDQ17DRAFT_451851 [Cyathus striatus]